jgi:hypothetical protein
MPEEESVQEDIDEATAAWLLFGDIPFEEDLLE